MASVTSLMNSTSSTSSLYGNRNVISGLASGMDTEAMIENSISGYKSKITSLQQKMTKMQWKQDAYRSLITQMSNMLSKYTSYTSSTNLFSASFFSKAVNTVANGTNASKVSATGRSSSDVAINGIKQLAQAASYTVGTNHLIDEGSKTEAINWDKDVETSAVSGSISIKYGGGETGKGSTFTLRFEKDEVYKSPDDLAKAINEKLKDKSIAAKDGSVSADTFIEAQADEDGTIRLVDKVGNYFAITSSSGDMAEYFKKGEKSEGSIASTQEFDASTMVNEIDKAEYLSDQSINVSLDGKTKKISLDFMKDYTAADGDKTKYLIDNLNAKLEDEFGKGKIQVGQNADGSLKFTKGDDKAFDKGTVVRVAGSSDIVNNALGLGEGGYSNAVQTGWTLEKALGSKAESIFTKPVTAKNADGTDKTNKDGNPLYIDKNGNETTEKDEAVKSGEIEINGKTIELNSNDTVQTMMDKINGSEAGVNVKFSSLTGRFSFTAKETGADTQIKIGGNLGEALFGKVENGQVDAASTVKGEYKAGTDAEFNVTINGETIDLKRSTNTVNLDGMNVTLKDTFGWKPSADDPNKLVEDPSAEKITFTTSTDSDKIVDAIKSFVEDYNKLVTELHDAYTTETLKDSKKNEYQPLTDDDMSKMSESAIEAYEKKAKTGILFGDTDLSNLYRKLTESVQGSGQVGAALRSIGLNVDFSSSSKLTTITLDEEALRSALDSDPDKVKDAFTQTTASGASANGLMAGLKNTLEQYGSTSIASPGILVNKAGTTLSSYSLSHNELNDQMESLQEQIEKWQDRMSDRVDFYTNQFTQLEMLINQMNSQSSALAGMMGG